MGYGADEAQGHDEDDEADHDAHDAYDEDNNDDHDDVGKHQDQRGTGKMLSL